MALNFKSSPKLISTGQTVNVNIIFENLGKHQNVQQVPFKMDISKGDKTIFSDFFYGSNGEASLQLDPAIHLQ